MRDVTLPDCRNWEEPLHLTAEERRALVIRIANEGPGALDAFIAEKEAEGDSRIAKALQRLRDNLLRQAEALRARLQQSFTSEREAILKAYEQEVAAIEARRREMAAHAEAERALGISRIDAELAQAELARLVLQAPPRSALPAWRRALAWLRRLVQGLLAILLWPLRALARLLGLRAEVETRGRSARVPVRGGGGVLMEVEAGLGDALLTSPDLRRAVRNRLNALPTRERMRALRNRLLGLEGYEDIARRLMAESLAEQAERKERERSEREREAAERIAALAEERAAREAAAEAAVKALERRHREELAGLERRVESDPAEQVKAQVVAELEGAGLLTRRNGELKATLKLMERFADVVFAEEARTLPAAKGGASGAFSDGSGIFLREPLRSSAEVSHMDTHATLLRARLRHPGNRHIYDDDVVVHREERGARLHVVLIVDRSLSMEENDRLLAAKRATLALWHAVMRENPRNRVDVLAMDTGVERIGLVEAWETKARGFTNTGRALREAAALLRAGKAERGLVFLITDGLPEAYTVDGVDGAGHPDRAMKYALEEARKLKALPAVVGTTLILLEPEDDLFVKAAEKLAKVLDARVIKTDPRGLAKDVLRAFDERGVPVVR